MATATAAAAVGRRRPVVVCRRGVRVGALGAVDFARLARHRAEQLLGQFVRGAQRERPLFEADFVLQWQMCGDVLGVYAHICITWTENNAILSC